MTNGEETFERKLNIFAPLVLSWGENHLREFPWRKELSDPYKLLSTEILLQKTSANNVLSVYSKFFDKFPTEENLANANLKDVLEIVEPTGLQSKKAKSLIKMAKWIKKNDVTKDSVKKMESEVVGVSSYVINAVLCFYFGEKVPLVDINVKKVMKWFFDVEDERQIEEILATCIRDLKGEELTNFYFSLLDLGASFHSSENLLSANVAIVPLREESFEKFVKEKKYWRFIHIDFTKEVSFLAAYRKAPVKAITHLGKIEKRIHTHPMSHYELSAIFELNPPIKIRVGEYPPVSFKYTELLTLLNASTYSQI